MGPGLLIVVASPTTVEVAAAIRVTRRLLTPGPQPAESMERQNCAVGPRGEYGCGGHTCECMSIL